MTHKSLTIAGWLTMISAFAAIPLTFLAFKQGSPADATGTIMLASMQIAGTALFVAITLFLKKLLNRIFSFHGTDRNIDLMIMANIVAAVFVVAGMYATQIKETASIAALVIMVFQGIVQLQFGYKLLKLQNNLGGMLKPFCYLNMATGVCVASIVLILAGVAVSAIADLMLATIFFTISKQLKEVERIRVEDQR